MSPAQLSRQGEGTRESNEGIVEGDLRIQKGGESEGQGEKKGAVRNNMETPGKSN